MPLQYDDEPGSWGRMSEKWPHVEIPKSLIEKYKRQGVFYPETGAVKEILKDYDDKFVPYGSYVIVDGFLRLENQEYVDKVQARLKELLATDRTKINCQNCGHWGFDMDMDPFCAHPNANSFGTNINTMRGTTRTPNMRGDPCGPEAKFFVQGEHRWASKEPHNVDA